MRRVRLILVTCAVLTLPVAAVAQNPIPKKATEPTAHNQDGQNAQPQPTPVHPVSSPSETTTQKQQSPPPEERNETIHSDNPDTDWWAIFAEVVAAIATVALAVVGAIAACAAIKTLRAIQHQGLIMIRQTRVLQRQTKATEDNAKAAKILAQIAAETERPKLMLHHIGMSDTHGMASLEAVLQYPAVDIAVKNFGKTEAFLVSQSVDFICGVELPDEPIYGHRTEWPPETVVEYGKTQFIGTYRPDDLIPPNDIEAIIDRTKALWIYGYVLYRDYFGNYHHMRFGKSILVKSRDDRTFYFWECGNKKYTENT